MKSHSLNHLRAFESVARLGSLNAAAQELNVTSSAVSKLINALEQRLNMRLFHRTQRRLWLTTQGQYLAAECNCAFETLRYALERVTQIKTDKQITVSCEPTIAIKWLIPRLQLFHQQHPDIEISVLCSGGPVAFSASNIDLAIRRNDFVMSEDLYVHFLADEWVAPLARMDLNKNETVTQLAKIHSRSRPQAWACWCAQNPKHFLAQLPHYMELNSSPLNFEHFYLSIEAIEAGLGVGIGSFYMSQSALVQKRLHAIAPFTQDGSQYMLISQQSVDLQPAYSAFRDWLQAQFAQDAFNVTTFNQDTFGSFDAQGRLNNK